MSLRRETIREGSLQWGDGVAHGGVFGASTYSVLKIEHEWRETKGGVTSAGRWDGADIVVDVAKTNQYISNTHLELEITGKFSLARRVREDREQH